MTGEHSGSSIVHPPHQSALSSPQGACSRLSLDDGRLGGAARVVACRILSAVANTLSIADFGLFATASAAGIMISRALAFGFMSPLYRVATVKPLLVGTYSAGFRRRRAAFPARDRNDLRRHLHRAFLARHVGRHLCGLHGGRDHLLARARNGGHRSQRPRPLRPRRSARGHRHGNPHGGGAGCLRCFRSTRLAPGRSSISPPTPSASSIALVLFYPRVRLRWQPRLYIPPLGRFRSRSQAPKSSSTFSRSSTRSPCWRSAARPYPASMRS